MPANDAGVRLASRVESALAALVIAVVVVGAALFAVTTPQSVRALVHAVGSGPLTGLSEQATADAAEAVRLFVVDPDAPPLPELIDGRPAFDESAVSHLVDVREVFVPARRLTLALLAVVVGWVIVRRRTARGRSVVGSATGTAGWMLLGAAGLGVLFGLVDFDALFTWFHGLFFEPGTWMFPEDALLIRVFPLPFWTTAGALWGGIVLMSAILLIVASRRLCFTRGTYGV